MSQPTALLPGERRILRLDEVEAKSRSRFQKPGLFERKGRVFHF